MPLWFNHLLKLKWFVYCRKWFIFKIYFALCNACFLFENLVHATWNFRYSAPILPFLFPLPTKLIKGWVLFLLSLLCSWLHLAEGAGAGRSRLGCRQVGAVRGNGQLCVPLLCRGGTQVGGEIGDTTTKQEVGTRSPCSVGWVCVAQRV